MTLKRRIPLYVRPEEQKGPTLKELYEQSNVFTDVPVSKRLLSFLPTEMTRLSPFFPKSRKDARRRILGYEKVWESSWGKFIWSGKELTIFDEDTLLVLLALVRKHRSLRFKTTYYEICKMKEVNPQPGAYEAIWKSLERLMSTTVKFEGWEEEDGKK